jgi:hypothetical protein
VDGHDRGIAAWSVGKVEVAAELFTVLPGINECLACHFRRGTFVSGSEMSKQVVVVLYVVAMIAVIVGVDFVFFRARFMERLIVNIGLVLVFGAFYLRFVKRLW